MAGTPVNIIWNAAAEREFILQTSAAYVILFALYGPKGQVSH
jgi:hypothetical protein